MAHANVAIGVQSVQFHGDTIFCTTINDQPFTPVKPIVENMGLAWQTQQRKLAANKKRWGITIMVTPTASGNQQTVCIPVRKLPAYLASINPKKVRAELRERIELYQAECDDVLWNYWTKGFASRQPVPLTPFPRIKTLPKSCRDQLNDLVLAKLSHVPPAFVWKTRMAIWAAFNVHFSIPRYNLLPEARMGEAIRLTTASACGILNFPKPVRPCRSLCPSQAGDNRGVFCFCHQGTSSGVGYILAEQRPGVREAPAVSLDRGALFRLFVSNSQTSEVHHV